MFFPGAVAIRAAFERSNKAITMKLSRWLPAAMCAASLLLAGNAFAKDKKEENEYPNATRAEPKVEMAAGDQRDLNKAADLVNENKSGEAQPLVEKILGNSKASK